MMTTHCYQYKIGKELDLSSLTDIEDLRPVEGSRLMEAKYGDVTVLVFESGELRAFIKGSELEQLKEALLAAGVKIMGLLQAIKAKGVDFDEQAVLSAGQQMELDFKMPKGTRPKLDAVVHVDSLRESVYAPYALMPEFQLERNAIQGGENIGRKMVQGKQNKDEVSQAIVDYLRMWKLGIAKHSSKPDDKGQSTYELEIFTVHESAFAAGMPVVNKALCHFIRGLIRGAYAAFFELENLNVKEKHCWGLGDTYCEFRMRVTPM